MFTSTFIEKKKETNIRQLDDTEQENQKDILLTDEEEIRKSIKDKGISDETVSL